MRTPLICFALAIGGFVDIGGGWANIEVAGVGHQARCQLGYIRGTWPVSEGGLPYSTLRYSVLGMLASFFLLLSSYTLYYVSD